MTYLISQLIVSIKQIKQRNVTSTSGKNCYIYTSAPNMAKENLLYRDVIGFVKLHTKMYHPHIIKKYANTIKSSFAGGLYAAT